MQSLNLPRYRDPLARIALFTMIGLAALIAIVQPRPDRASASDVIIIATPPLPYAPGVSTMVDKPLTRDAPTAERAPTPEPTPEPMAPIVVQLSPPTPQAPAEVAGGTPDQTAANPWQGMETVNGHSFVPTVNPYAGMETVIYSVPAEDYNSLPTLSFENEPPAPTAAPTAKDYEWSRQRTR